MDNIPTQEVLYARLLPRVRALVIDMAIYVGAMVVFVVVASAKSSDTTDANVLFRIGAMGFLASYVLYEPLMVWRLGGTLGHISQNLRIVSDRTGANPGLVSSFTRWLVKLSAGALSFFFMALTRRHQALHDSASRTTVQVRDRGRMSEDHFIVGRSVPVGAVDVSRLRRITVIFVWQAVVFVCCVTAVALVLSEECLSNNRCTDGEDLLLTVGSLAWLIIAGVTLVLGWKGRLIGARRRSA
ncbi:MAG: RDD family protein [Nitrospirota bacterium]